jgi:transketolase
MATTWNKLWRRLRGTEHERPANGNHCADQERKGVSFIEDKDAWHGKPLKKGEEVGSAELLMACSTGDDCETIPCGQVKPAWKPMAAPDYKLGEPVATREAYGAALSKLGAANSSVVAMDGDTKNSTFAEKFMKTFPDRFFEGFIAEQNLVGFSVGLSKCGKIPFASTFGAFFGRAMDHLRMGAISMANIKCVGSHCGVSIGEDGPSQMALEDLAMFRAIPNAVVFYPSDAVSTKLVPRCRPPAFTLNSQQIGALSNENLK